MIAQLPPGRKSVSPEAQPSPQWPLGGIYQTLPGFEKFFNPDLC